MLFAVLGAAECLGEGANLPLAEANRSGVYGCAIYAYHLLLLCTLLAAVMIEADGHRFPLGLAGPALVGGLCAPLAWPRLRPVPASRLLLHGWTAGLADGGLGLAAGLLLGRLAAPLRGPRQKTGAIVGPACVGLFLGWQAVVVLTVITVAVDLALRGAGRLVPRIRRLPPNAWLALATLAWILAWKPLLGLSEF